MMDWTDRHCRYFLRQVSARARLYTEMITTGALIHFLRPPIVEPPDAGGQWGGRASAWVARTTAVGMCTRWRPRA